MRARTAARLRSRAWQVVLAGLAFLQIVATFGSQLEPLYVVKWVGGIAIAASFLVLGRWKMSTRLAREFILLELILAVGLVSQLSDTLDARAIALAATYTVTGVAAFLIAPCAFRRRSVHRTVWPAMLLGVTAGVLLGEYLGLRDPLGAIGVDQGRWRFQGAFYLPNAAGSAALVGVILAVVAFGTTRRWWYLLTIPPLVLVMELADSRGSVLAAWALLALPLTVWVVRWPVRRTAIVTSLALLVLVGAALLDSGRLRWPDTSHAEARLNALSTDRLANWEDALGYLHGPVEWAFGLGLSRNLSFVARETDLPVAVRGSNADNFYVDLLGRVGVVGLLMFLGIVGLLTGRLCRGLRTASARVAALRGLALGVLAATLVLGLTNSIIFTWASIHSMVAWPLVAAESARPNGPSPTALRTPDALPS